MDTDKKHSQLNTLHSRGKRVIAEATIPRACCRAYAHHPEAMYAARMASSQLGSLMAGAMHNGVHPGQWHRLSVFIATGRDEANVAESPPAWYMRNHARGDYGLGDLPS